MSVTSTPSSTPGHTHSLVAAALQEHLSKKYSVSQATPTSLRSRGVGAGLAKSSSKLNRTPRTMNISKLVSSE